MRKFFLVPLFLGLLLSPVASLDITPDFEHEIDIHPNDGNLVAGGIYPVKFKFNLEREDGNLLQDKVNDAVIQVDVNGDARVEKVVSDDYSSSSMNQKSAVAYEREFFHDEGAKTLVVYLKLPADASGDIKVEAVAGKNDFSGQIQPVNDPSNQFDEINEKSVTYKIRSFSDTTSYNSNAKEARAKADYSDYLADTYLSLVDRKSLDNIAAEKISEAQQTAMVEGTKSAILNYATGTVTSSSKIADASYATYDTYSTVSDVDRMARAQDVPDLFGIGGIAKLSAETIEEMGDSIARRRIQGGDTGEDYNSSKPLEELSDLYEKEAEAWENRNLDKVRQVLKKQQNWAREKCEYRKCLLFEAADQKRLSKSNYNHPYSKDLPHAYDFFDSLIDYSSRVDGRAEDLRKTISGPKPHVKNLNSTSNIEQVLEESGSKDIQFDLRFRVSNSGGQSNIDNFFSISHSESLEIVEIENHSAPAAFNYYHPGDYSTNATGESERLENPLVDIKSVYQKDQKQRFTVTFESVENSDAWISYRAAMMPVFHEEFNGDDSKIQETYVRYPHKGHKDQQGYHAIKIDSTGKTSNRENLPPEASVTISQNNAVTGEAVNLDAGGSSDEKGITQYKWEIDRDKDGNYEDTYNGEKIKPAFSTSGTKILKLTVKDAEGAKDSVEKRIRVQDTKPLSAGFRVQQGSVEPGENFKVRATVDADSYNWDLDGDGSYEKSGREISSSYQEGKHDIILKVERGGKVDETSQKIEVITDEERVEKPVAKFDAPDVVQKGETLRVDGSGSIDVDYDGQITTENVDEYLWDFNSDSNIEKQGSNPQYTFNSAGNHQISLKVKDDEGNIDKEKKQILVTSESSMQLKINSIDKKQTYSYTDDGKINATIENTGNSQSNQEVALFIEGNKESGKTVKIDSEEVEEVAFNFSISDKTSRDYNFEIRTIDDFYSGTFTMKGNQGFVINEAEGERELTSDGEKIIVKTEIQNLDADLGKKQQYVNVSVDQHGQKKKEKKITDSKNLRFKFDAKNTERGEYEYTVSTNSEKKTGKIQFLQIKQCREIDDPGVYEVVENFKTDVQERKDFEGYHYPCLDLESSNIRIKGQQKVIKLSSGNDQIDTLKARSVNNITLSNLDVEGSDSSFYGGQISLHGVNHSTLKNLKLPGIYSSTIYDTRSANGGDINLNYVKNLSIQNSEFEGLTTSKSSGLHIEENVMNTNFLGSNNSTVEDNFLVSWEGIKVIGSGNLIKNNTFEEKEANYISVEGDNNTIIYNNLTNATWGSIVVEGSNNVVGENFVSGSKNYSNFRETEGFGVAPYDNSPLSINNLFYNNTILTRGQALKIGKKSSSNTFQNTIIRNTKIDLDVSSDIDGETFITNSSIANNLRVDLLLKPSEAGLELSSVEEEEFENPSPQYHESLDKYVNMEVKDGASGRFNLSLNISYPDAVDDSEIYMFEKCGDQWGQINSNRYSEISKIGADLSVQNKTVGLMKAQNREEFEKLNNPCEDSRNSSSTITAFDADFRKVQESDVDLYGVIEYSFETEGSLENVTLGLKGDEEPSDGDYPTYSLGEGSTDSVNYTFEKESDGSYSLELHVEGSVEEGKYNWSIGEVNGRDVNSDREVMQTSFTLDKASITGFDARYAEGESGIIEGGSSSEDIRGTVYTEFNTSENLSSVELALEDLSGTKITDFSVENFMTPPPGELLGLSIEKDSWDYRAPIPIEADLDISTGNYSLEIGEVNGREASSQSDTQEYIYIGGPPVIDDFFFNTSTDYSVDSAFIGSTLDIRRGRDTYNLTKWKCKLCVGDVVREEVKEQVDTTGLSEGRYELVSGEEMIAQVDLFDTDSDVVSRIAGFSYPEVSVYSYRTAEELTGNSVNVSDTSSWPNDMGEESVFEMNISSELENYWVEIEGDHNTLVRSSRLGRSDAEYRKEDCDDEDDKEILDDSDGTSSSCGGGSSGEELTTPFVQDFQPEDSYTVTGQVRLDRNQTYEDIQVVLKGFEIGESGGLRYPFRRAPPTMTTLTNSTGGFRFENVPEGDYSFGLGDESFVRTDVVGAEDSFRDDIKGDLSYESDISVFDDRDVTIVGTNETGTLNLSIDAQEGFYYGYEILKDDSQQLMIFSEPGIGDGKNITLPEGIYSPRVIGFPKDSQTDERFRELEKLEIDENQTVNRSVVFKDNVYINGTINGESFGEDEYAYVSVDKEEGFESYYSRINGDSYSVQVPQDQNYTVEFNPPYDSDYQTEKEDVWINETGTEVDFTVDSGKYVAGTVEANGDPVKAQVTVYNYSKDIYKEGRTFRGSDTDGSFNLTGLKEGGYNIDVEPLRPEYRFISREIQVTGEGENLDTFEVGRNLTELNVSVQVNSDSEEELRVSMFSEQVNERKRKQIKPNTTAQFDVPQGTTWNIRVDSRGADLSGAETSVKVVEDREVDLTVVELVEYEAQVRTDDGDGVQAYVYAYNDSRDSRDSVRTDKDGGFELELKDVPHKVEVWPHPQKEDLPYKETNITVQEISEGDDIVYSTQDLNLTYLAGNVTGPGGEPVEGVIAAWNESERSSSYQELENGSYNLTGLQNVTHNLWIRSENQSLPMKKTTVDPGDVNTKDYTLGSNTSEERTLVVTVNPPRETLPEDEPAVVSTSTTEKKTNSSGKVEFELTEGTKEEITVNRPGWTSVIETVNIVPGTGDITREYTLNRTEEYDVEVNVTQPSTGEQVDSEVVVAFVSRDNQSSKGGITTFPDSSPVISGLTAGDDYLVSVSGTNEYENATAAYIPKDDPLGHEGSLNVTDSNGEPQYTVDYEVTE
jgi:hypothetical protein